MPSPGGSYAAMFQQQHTQQPGGPAEVPAAAANNGRVHSRSPAARAAPPGGMTRVRSTTPPAGGQTQRPPWRSSRNKSAGAAAAGHMSMQARGRQYERGPSHHSTNGALSDYEGSLSAPGQHHGHRSGGAAYAAALATQPMTSVDGRRFVAGQPQPHQQPPSRPRSGTGSGVVSPSLNGQRAQQHPHAHPHPSLPPTATLRPRSPGPSSTSSANGFAAGRARADALSGEIFRSKLQAIMALREQIEALAAKHRQEEEALSNVLSTMRFDDGDDTEAAAQRKSQEELVRALVERDRTIEMLDTFRREGNAVIQRMHENLKRTSDQHEAAVRRVDELTRENDALKRQVAELRKGGAGTAAANGAAGIDTSLPLRDEAAEVAIAAHEQRAREYAELVEDAEAVIRGLRQQNESLQAQLRQQQHPSTASESATPPLDGAVTPDQSTEDASPATRRAVEEMRDQLRTERRQRLQIEEQSQQILLEQQRQIDLLEQRLAQAQAVRTANGGTPRSARAGGLSGRRSSSAAVNMSPMSPSEQQIERSPGFASSRSGGSFAQPAKLQLADPTPAQPRPAPANTAGSGDASDSASSRPPRTPPRSSPPADAAQDTATPSPAALHSEGTPETKAPDSVPAGSLGETQATDDEAASTAAAEARPASSPPRDDADGPAGGGQSASASRSPTKADATSADRADSGADSATDDSGSDGSGEEEEDEEDDDDEANLAAQQRLEELQKQVDRLNARMGTPRAATA